MQSSAVIRSLSICFYQTRPLVVKQLLKLLSFTLLVTYIVSVWGRWTDTQVSYRGYINPINHYINDVLRPSSSVFTLIKFVSSCPRFHVPLYSWKRAVLNPIYDETLPFSSTIDFAEWYCTVEAFVKCWTCRPLITCCVCFRTYRT